MNKPLVLAFLVILGIGFMLGNGVTAQTVANAKLTKSGNYYLFPETADLKPVLSRMSNNLAADEVILVQYTGANAKFNNYANHEYAIQQSSTNNGQAISHYITLYFHSGTGDTSFYIPIDCDSSIDGVYRIPVPTEPTASFSDILNKCDATLPDDFESEDGKTQKQMDPFLSAGTTIVNESITLGNYTVDGGTVAAPKTSLVQQTASMLEADYTQCNVPTDAQEINLTANNTFGLGANNLPLNSGSIPTNFNAGSNFPVSFIFKANGVQKYMLQVWEYSVNDSKARIRANLCYNEGGFKNYWTNVDYITYTDELFTKKDETVVKNTSTVEVTIKESISNPEIQARFLRDYRGEIRTYFYIVETGNTIQVRGVAFDGSRDRDNTILRTKLTDTTIEALRAKVPAFTNLSPNEITQRVMITLEGKQNTSGKLVGLPFQSTAEGQIAVVNSYNEKYYKSPANQLIPGPYTAIIRIDPTGPTSITEWEIIEKNIILSPADFSPEDGKIINPNHIYQIGFDAGDIIKDICSKCTDLVSCLACVDNSILTSYER